MSDVCFVCLQPPAEIQVDGETHQQKVRCRFCGCYALSGEIAQEDSDRLTENGANRYLLSGVVRENSEAGRLLLLTRENISELISAAHPPRDPFEAIDRLLWYIFDTAPTPTDYVRITPATDYPLVFARNGHELAFYLTKAVELSYVERSAENCRLDLAGWKRLDELRRTRTISDQAFVAMWFAPEMLNVWHEGIQPALEATGYHPLRLDMEEHNDKVDDRIIAEIRRSGLVVADFSGDRSNVYFEAGFALGLGIPVIWTCRESDVQNLHFDIRQYNYIAWSDPADLKAKLQLRIEATISDYPGAR